MRKPSEQTLPGGNVGSAARVGDTVRRPAGPWTPAVHALLRHLESAGFAESPRALGVDEKGREILTCIEGETVGDAQPWPDWTREDATLVQTAPCHLIRSSVTTTSASTTSSFAMAASSG